MNMEDRLREAFGQEAEQLHAPHGSPETAIRRGRRRRASNLIGGAALVLTLVGGTAAGVQLLGNTDEPAEENLTSSVETDRTVDESISSDLQAAGIADFVWERVTLPTPDDTTVWNIQVAAREGSFVAVGTGFIEGGSAAGTEQLMVWDSPNGIEWSLNMIQSPFDGSLDQMLVTDDGFVAVVRSFDGRDGTVDLYTSSDGAAWTAGEVDLGAVNDNQHIWFAGAASGNGTTVVGGILQTEPPTPPITLEGAGVILRENPYEGGFTVSDLETGDVITTVPWDTFYAVEDVLTVYGDDGAVVLSIPWESFYAAQDEGQLDAEVLTVEKDGVQLDLDNTDGTYVATDVASGAVLASGGQEELFQPGRIQIAHPDTGELLVDIEMDEFYRAEERSYEGDGDFAPASEVLLLATSDGSTWERIEIGSEDAQEIDVNGVSYGPNGFVFSANRYGTSFGKDIWISADGRTWDVVVVGEVEGDTRNGPMVNLGAMYYSLDYSPRGQAGIASSPDGVNWSTAYRADNRDLYFNSLTAGELGIVAIGQENETDYGPPLVISKEGRTMVLDQELGRVTVTEDSTGEILTVIEIDIYFEDPPPQFQIDDETESLTLLDEDGTVLMFITQEEGEAAATAQERDLEVYEGSIPQPKVAFSPDGTEWFVATTEGLDVAWPQGVAVGEDAVVIVGTSIESVYSNIDYGSDGSEATLTLGGGSSVVEESIGPADGYYEPETYVWVGTPR
jgi:hypothetical protein